MKITFIEVPYHYGFIGRGVGAGRGAACFLDAGAAENLDEESFDVFRRSVHRRSEGDEVLAAVAEGNSLLAGAVRETAARDSFPFVLSGGCNACLGVLAGLAAPVGIIWFDAHGDFNTPETTPSGFFDGMPLAVATGLCHTDLWNRIAATPSVPPANALLVAVRDLDPGERDNIHRSGLPVVTAGEIKTSGVAAALQPRLEQLRARVETIYLHFDIDTLDPALAPGVDYPTPGGLSLQEATEAIELIGRQFRIGAASLTAYNPDREQDSLTLNSGLRLIEAISAAAQASIHSG